MPLGEDIHEHVAVAGYFLKSWAYPIRRVSDGKGPDGKPLLRQQLAPLLMGRRTAVVSPKTPQRGMLSQIMLRGVLTAVSLLVGLWLWRQRRGDETVLPRQLEEA